MKLYYPRVNTGVRKGAFSLWGDSNTIGINAFFPEFIDV